MEAADALGIKTHARHAKALRFSAVDALRRAPMDSFQTTTGSAHHAARDAYWAVNTRHGTIFRYHNLTDITEKGHQAVLDVFDVALADVGACRC